MCRHCNRYDANNLWKRRVPRRYQQSTDEASLHETRAHHDDVTLLHGSRNRTSRVSVDGVFGPLPLLAIRGHHLSHRGAVNLGSVSRIHTEHGRHRC